MRSNYKSSLRLPETDRFYVTALEITVDTQLYTLKYVKRCFSFIIFSLILLQFATPKTLVQKDSDWGTLPCWRSESEYVLPSIPQTHTWQLLKWRLGLYFHSRGCMEDEIGGIKDKRITASSVFKLLS